MSFQDRYSDRDSEHSRFGALQWLLNGTVPLFKVASIRVRAHIWLLIFIFLTLIQSAGASGYTFEHRAISMGMLVLAVLIHEFGHALTAIALGGYADEIILTPLGGLARAQAPQRPWPTFLTIAAGPAANLLTCVVCAGVLWTLRHVAVPHNPLSGLLAPEASWSNPIVYVWYLYVTSYLLMLFNLLPILPLDGGQMLQTILWRWIGYGKAMLTAATVGIVGAAIVGMYGLVTGNLFLFLIMALMCLPWCIQQRMAVQSAGVWSFTEFDDRPQRSRRHRLSRYTKWRARRQIRSEEIEQTRIDAILQKVHDHGLVSLTWGEKRILRRATQRQRQREMEETHR